MIGTPPAGVKAVSIFFIASSTNNPPACQSTANIGTCRRFRYTLLLLSISTFYCFQYLLIAMQYIDVALAQRHSQEPNIAPIIHTSTIEYPERNDSAFSPLINDGAGASLKLTLAA